MTWSETSKPGFLASRPSLMSAVKLKIKIIWKSGPSKLEKRTKYEKCRLGFNESTVDMRGSRNFRQGVHPGQADKKSSDNVFFFFFFLVLSLL